MASHYSELARNTVQYFPDEVNMGEVFKFYLLWITCTCVCIYNYICEWLFFFEALFTGLYFLFCMFFPVTPIMVKSHLMWAGLQNSPHFRYQHSYLGAWQLDVHIISPARFAILYYMPFGAFLNHLPFSVRNLLHLMLTSWKWLSVE